MFFGFLLFGSSLVLMMMSAMQLAMALVPYRLIPGWRLSHRCVTWFELLQEHWSNAQSVDYCANSNSEC